MVTITKIRSAENGYCLNGEEMLLLSQGMVAGIGMGMSINKKGYEYTNEELQQTFDLLSNIIVSATCEAEKLAQESIEALLDGKIQ